MEHQAEFTKRYTHRLDAPAFVQLACFFITCPIHSSRGYTGDYKTSKDLLVQNDDFQISSTSNLLPELNYRRLQSTEGFVVFSP
jgi:hypothetical protein